MASTTDAGQVAGTLGEGTKSHISFCSALNAFQVLPELGTEDTAEKQAESAFWFPAASLASFSLCLTKSFSFLQVYMSEWIRAHLSPFLVYPPPLTF